MAETSAGRSGCLAGSVGVGNGQSAVRVQADAPAVVVDSVMVAYTERQQVVEIGQAAVFPSDDVMDGLEFVERLLD